MRKTDICYILIAFVLANIVLGEPADDREYDDEHVEFDSERFHMIYDLAMKPKRGKHEFVHPYRASDFEKLVSNRIPNRYKQRVIFNYDRFIDDIKMEPRMAAFESLRYSSEDMMDIYQGRLNSLDDMTKLKVIRTTDPIRFIVAARIADEHWHKVIAQKLRPQETPTFKDFREFLTEYNKVIKPGPRAA